MKFAYKRGDSYRNLAQDILTLVTDMRIFYEKIQKQTRHVVLASTREADFCKKKNN